MCIRDSSWTDPDTFYPLYLGWLEIEETTGQSELEPWLIQLNQASAFMGLGSWDDAIRLLRGIRAGCAVRTLSWRNVCFTLLRCLDCH